MNPRKHSQWLALYVSVIVPLVLVAQTSAQSLFTLFDDFDRYPSPSVVTNAGYTNGYSIRFGAASGPQDFKVIFGFDYSTVSYPVRIPPAPHSMGTTKGLYLTVNKDGAGAAAAVNVYHNQDVSFDSPDYFLKFDFWMNLTNLASSTEQIL